MFSTLKQRIILVIYVFLVLSIPVGAYLASNINNQELKTEATQEDRKIDLGSEPLTPLEELKTLLQSPQPSAVPLEAPEPDPSPTTTATTFGPTLNLKLILEGRPSGSYASRVFIGISDGTSTNGAPNYVLSFTIDLPDDGVFDGLSLAGLTTGKEYLAYIKPTAQIATSSAFVMSPSINTLNNGNPLTLLTGDLNEDNVINSADYSIVKNALGATPTAEKWNVLADFNQDGIINSFDLGIIVKNLAKTGQSGVWISTPTPTGSAVETPATPSGSTGGYWLWMPAL